MEETLMNNKKVRILSVGIGGFANVYLQKMLFEESDKFEIVGGVDVYPEGAKFYPDFCAKNIPIYADMEDFYREHEADLAIITTPIHLHTKQMLTALEHGSNVMCEKPLSGVSTDAELVEKCAEKNGKFVIIGYQWSYSDAILNLKSDILAGVYGKPVFLKTMILWPRKRDYFTRGTGWAGKLRAKDGTVINDSVAANATAHYLHNMLFVCGEEGLAAEAKNIKADLIRVNNIENFDNTTITFELECGAKCLFVAAHSTVSNHNPIFEYRFENAVIKYDETTKQIIAYFNDGTTKEYGSPFEGSDVKKIYRAIDGCNEEGFKPVCSAYTAAAHTRVIEAVQQNPIYSVKEEYLEEKDNLIYIKDFVALLNKCYREEIMLRDTEEFGNMVK